jgi:hypothetical protein
MPKTTTIVSKQHIRTVHHKQGNKDSKILYTVHHKQGFKDSKCPKQLLVSKQHIRTRIKCYIITKQQNGNKQFDTQSYTKSYTNLRVSKHNLCIQLRTKRVKFNQTRINLYHS